MAKGEYRLGKNEYSRQWRKKRKEELGDYYTSYNSRWRIKYPERYLLQCAKGSAKKTGREFSLVEEDIKIPSHCPVLGIPLEVKAGLGLRDNIPSIDRIDSSKGYTKDNIQIISWRANNLKSNGTLEEFQKLVRFMGG